MAVRRRLILSLVVLFIVSQVVYGLGLNWLQDHWFMPLRVGDKVYVINRKASLVSIHRGDLVAYIPRERAEVASGFGRLPPGQSHSGPGRPDRIHWCELSGQRRPFARLRLMPVVAACASPKNMADLAFVAYSNRNNVGDDVIAGSVLAWPWSP